MTRTEESSIPAARTITFDLTISTRAGFTGRAFILNPAELNDAPVSKEPDRN
jgi:hypothetical protein